MAVLGTGSTASQLLPEVAKVADKVYSVQRSPTWILPKPDRPYTERERWIFAHVPFAKKLYRTRLWLRSESNISVIENGSDKTQEFKAIALRMLGSNGRRRRIARASSLRITRWAANGWCSRRTTCRRLTQPNVEVVSSPARSLRARSLVTEDGTELDVDVVVCATGYAAADYLGQIDVVGEGGAIAARHLAATGRIAYLGMAVPGFPNFFMLYGPNTNVGSNSVIFMLEAQAHYIVRALKYLRRRRKSLRRGAARGDGGLHRQDRPVDGGHRLDDPVQQLLPRGQRPRGHAVAAQRACVLGDDAPVQARRLQLSPPAMSAVDADACIAGRRSTDWTASSGSTRRCARLPTRAPTLPPDSIPLIRESLNERRRDAAAQEPHATGVEIVETRGDAIRHGAGAHLSRRAVAPAPAVIYCHAGAFVLGNLDTDHRQCVEARPPRPLHGDLGRLPAGAGTPVSGRARRRDRGAGVGGRQCDGTGHRPRPAGRRGQQRRWRAGRLAGAACAPTDRCRRSCSSCCTNRCSTTGHRVEGGVPGDPGFRRRGRGPDVAPLPGPGQPPSPEMLCPPPKPIATVCHRL